MWIFTWEGFLDPRKIYKLSDYVSKKMNIFPTLFFSREKKILFFLVTLKRKSFFMLHKKWNNQENQARTTVFPLLCKSNSMNGPKLESYWSKGKCALKTVTANEPTRSDPGGLWKPVPVGKGTFFNSFRHILFLSPLKKQDEPGTKVKIFISDFIFIKIAAPLLINFPSFNNLPLCFLVFFSLVKFYHSKRKRKGKITGQGNKIENEIIEFTCWES